MGLKGPAIVSAAAVLVGAGWGYSKSPPPGSSRTRATLDELLKQPGEDVALAMGTADYATGLLRVSFLVIRHDGQPVYRPQARVYVAASLSSRPFAEATAVSEPIGVPGESGPAAGDVTRLYVAHVLVPRAGKYFMLAEPVGGKPIQGIANLIVRDKPLAPAVGSKATASPTPTIASTHGNFAALTTASPPDKALLRYSVAGSLAAHRPFVLVFATPKFCTSRTCGPVVDVVNAVRRRSAGKNVRFIHVEIYKNNNPTLGPNRWVTEWHLPSEPWTFLVGRDGRIKARFEGSMSVGELAAAVQRYLVEG